MLQIMGNKFNKVTKDTMDTDRHNKVTELQTDKIYSLAGECLFEGTVNILTSNERIETVVDLTLTDDLIDTEKASQDIAISFTKDQEVIDSNEYTKAIDLQSNKISSFREECVGDPSKVPDSAETTFTVDTTASNGRIETVLDLTDDSVDTEKTSQDIATTFTENIQEVINTNKNTEVTDLQNNKISSYREECVGDPSKVPDSAEKTFTVDTTASNERDETDVNLTNLTDDSVDTEKTSQNIATTFTENVQAVIDTNENTEATDLHSNKISSFREECVGDPSNVPYSNETTGIMIDLTQNSVDTEESSKDVAVKTSQEDRDTMDVDDNKETDIQSSKQYYAIKIDFSETSCKVEKNEIPTGLIDFEELIDITRDFTDTDKNIPDIQEFERVLSSFPTAGTSNTNDNEIFSLDEVDEFFENLVTESSSICSQTIHNVQASEHTVVKIDNLDINANKIIEEIGSQSNDEGSLIIKTTTAGVEIDNEENIYLISSIEETDSIDSDGYNSSDFEFITENEAKMDGFIINFSRNDVGNNKNEHKYYHFDRNFEYYDLDDTPQKYGEKNAYEDLNDPGEGPSGLNGTIEDYNSRDYRENHHVPDEEGYLNLFHGANPALPLADIIFLENKSARPLPMNFQYEGIGFVNQILRRQCQPDSSDEEFADEAKECIEKILFMYPDENRKPKRRRY